ncbi:uncharacterized protein LOC117644469 [Thrips palmi]|uniref:Uncharacterized protein LOC117644469 n=1 Tax=Thrips palmi TaxID=161013 RepID=A0A6P8YJ68_THRPL|nr:uncharacterized protein LOC117644469 [Thrips palmi]
MHLRDLKGHIEGFIYRPQKLQSIPVNDTNGCHTYLKSEVKVENHEPHSFKDKPSCSVDKPLDSKISLNESQCSFEENLYSHSFDEVPITSEDNPLHSEMSVDASQETWDPDFFKEKSATFLESPIKSEMSLITSQLTFEESLDSHSFEEEPITSVDNQRNSEMSLTASQFLFEDSMVPVSHPLNNSYKRQKDPLAISPVKGRPDNSHHPTDQLLARAAEALRMRLKPNWICLLEGKGIHSMQLSRNFEKCTQRRIFFNTCGDVHLSVHCVPIPITNFVPCLKMVWRELPSVRQQEHDIYDEKWTRQHKHNLWGLKSEASERLSRKEMKLPPSPCNLLVVLVLISNKFADLVQVSILWEKRGLEGKPHNRHALLVALTSIEILGIDRLQRERLQSCGGLLPEPLKPSFVKVGPKL